MSVLKDQVLVLNKYWLPIGTISVKRAILKLTADRGVVVCPDTYKLYPWEAWVEKGYKENDSLVHSVYFNLKAPEVIAVMAKVVRSTRVAFTRERLFKRDNFICQYCHQEKNQNDLSVDHVRPRCLGGKTTWLNCVTACKPCNLKKSDTMPGKKVPKLTRKPAAPRWELVIDIKPSWKKFLKIKD